MTADEMKSLFKENEGLFLQSDCITERLSQMDDLHAFLLLDKLVPGQQNIIDGASHDEIYISIDVDKLAEVITPEQIQELIRCGIMYSDEVDSLMMFT
jgi:hypothetical protein